MTQSVQVAYETMSLPKASQIRSRNEKVGPEIPKINSSSKAQLFLTGLHFFLYPWAHLLNFSLFWILKISLSAPLLCLHQALMHAFIYARYS